jgi:hypothetical protein
MKKLILALAILGIVLTPNLIRAEEFGDVTVLGEMITKSTPVIDVRAYGAVGNGVANDTVAIQAAVDAAVTAGGGVVFFPKGTYLVTQILKVFSSTVRITLRGVGRDVSAISKYGAGTDTLIDFSVATIAGGHLVIEDLAVQGGSAKGIALTNLAWFDINRVYFVASTVGLDLHGAITGLIRNCNFYVNVVGIKADKTTGQGGSNFIKIKDCVFGGNSELAIDWIRDDGLYMENCDLEVNGTAESNVNLMAASWVNGNYETFASSEGNVTSAISSGGGGNETATNDIPDLTAGTIYELTYNLTLNSGLAPILYVMRDNGVTPVLCLVGAMSSGVHRIMFTAPANSEKLLLFSVQGQATNFSCTFSLKVAPTKGAIRIRSTVGELTGYSLHSIKGCWFESNIGYDVFCEPRNTTYLSITDSRGYANGYGIFTGGGKFTCMNNMWPNAPLDFDAGAINIVGWVNNCVFTSISGIGPHYIHILGTDYNAAFIPTWSSIITAPGFVGPLTGSADSLKSPATTGLATLTGMGAGTTRNYTMPNADATLLYSGGALGTPTSGTLTNCTFPTLNQNTSGTAANLSGTPALPNGTTATTQSQADNSTKLSTTAYVDTGLGTKVKSDGSVNPTQLLSNGDFENWSAGTSVAPDGWTLNGGGAIAREASTIKLGTYSAKFTGTSGSIQQTVSASKGYAYYVGRKLTFGCWVWSDAANRIRIKMGSTGVDESISSYHTGNSTWQLLTIEYTVNATGTAVIVNPTIEDGGSISAYFDGAMCVEGESAFAFADKPASEGVWANYGATSTVVGFSGSPTKEIYVKKIGKTVFVNYYITGTSNATNLTFTLPYTASSTSTAWGSLCILTEDNATVLAVPAKAQIVGGASTVTAYKDATGAVNWTNSGAKSILGQFFYESA